jgi:plastocyanin
MSTHRSRTPLILAACLTMAVLAATGASADGRRVPSRVTKTVRAIVSHWSPTSVRIAPGDVIKWRAISGMHTVSAYGGNWAFNRQLSTGAVEDRTFRRAGTFRFRCQFHSTLAGGRCTGMCGKVVVRS